MFKVLGFGILTAALLYMIGITPNAVKERLDRAQERATIASGSSSDWG